MESDGFDARQVTDDGGSRSRSMADDGTILAVRTATPSGDVLAQPGGELVRMTPDGEALSAFVPSSQLGPNQIGYARIHPDGELAVYDHVSQCADTSTDDTTVCRRRTSSTPTVAILRRWGLRPITPVPPCGSRGPRSWSRGFSAGSPWATLFPDTCRYAGTGREHTAALIADTVVAEHAPTRALLARGDEFADAITGGAYAAEAGTPILLTPSGSLNADTDAWLRRTARITEVVVLGGATLVSDAQAKPSPSPPPADGGNPTRPAGAAPRHRRCGRHHGPCWWCAASQLPTQVSLRENLISAGITLDVICDGPGVAPHRPDDVRGLRRTVVGVRSAPQEA